MGQELFRHQNVEVQDPVKEMSTHLDLGAREGLSKIMTFKVIPHKCHQL
jgi:hypothetical protein